MKILQVLPALEEGGVEKGCLDIAAALTEAGHEAHILSKGGRMVHRLEYLGGIHHDFHGNWKNPTLYFSHIAKLINLIKAQNIDLIHVRSRAPAWVVLRAAKETKTPFISTFHGAYGHQNFAKKYYNQVMLKGKAVIAVSEFIKHHIEEIYQYDAHKIHVIPRAVDCNLYRPGAVKMERIKRLSDQWQLEHERYRIGIIGRLSSIKGHMLLVEALGLIKDAPLECICIGDYEHQGDFTKAISEKASALNLDHQLRFVGHCDDIPAAMMLLDCVVSAATKPESFGRTVIEGQAMERIVIAPRHGGAVELIEDGVTGFHFAPNDAVSLAEAIRKAIALTENKRNKMVRRARKEIETHYDLPLMTTATLKIYEDILTGN